MDKNNITNIVNDFFLKEKWGYSYSKSGYFSFNLFVDCPFVNLLFKLVLEERYIIIYSLLPIGVNIDDSKMVCSMAEFVCKVNSLLRKEGESERGSLEFDIKHGLICYRVDADCEKEPSIAIDIIRESIYIAASTIEFYSYEIINIILKKDLYKSTSLEDTTKKENVVTPVEEISSYSVKELFSIHINELLDKPKESADGH